MKYQKWTDNYKDLQAKNLNKVIFYRLGDFYEVLGIGAMVAANALDLTLTTRDCGEEERIMMCGIPYHCRTEYQEKLEQSEIKAMFYEGETL